MSFFLYSIVYKDDKCLAKPGVKAVMELLVDEDVDVILGPICSTGKARTCFLKRVILN